MVLVLMLGGCTFAELSALRFSAAPGPGEGGFGREILVAATKMVTGDRLVESLMAAPTPWEEGGAEEGGGEGGDGAGAAPGGGGGGR